MAEDGSAVTEFQGVDLDSTPEGQPPLEDLHQQETAAGLDAQTHYRALGAAARDSRLRARNIDPVQILRRANERAEAATDATAAAFPRTLEHAIHALQEDAEHAIGRVKAICQLAVEAHEKQVELTVQYLREQATE